MGDLRQRRATVLVALSVALAVVATSHAAEDFQYGEFAWLGGAAWLPALALGCTYALQLVGAYWLGKGKRFGAMLLGCVGVIWCAGALLVHGHEILQSGEYRHGLVSKALEVIIILLGASIGVAAFPR